MKTMKIWFLTDCCVLQWSFCNITHTRSKHSQRICWNAMHLRSVWIVLHWGEGAVLLLLCYYKFTDEIVLSLQLFKASWMQNNSTEQKCSESQHIPRLHARCECMLHYETCIVAHSTFTILTVYSKCACLLHYDTCPIKKHSNTIPVDRNRKCFVNTYGTFPVV